MNGEINFNIDMNVFLTVVVSFVLLVGGVYVVGEVVDLLKKNKRDGVQKKNRK